MKPARPAPRPTVPAAGSGRPRLGADFWLILVLAVLELAWLGWYLIEPLPNVPQEHGAMRRGFLLLKAFPEIVPETTFRQSFFGQALEELSHWENLPQRLPVVAVSGIILLAAMGLGELILGVLRLRAHVGLATRLALDYGLGATGLGVLTLLAGRLGMLNPWLFRAALSAIAVTGLASSGLWKLRPPAITRQGILGACLIAPFLLIMVLGAMLPTIDFDVLEYHLQGPKEYYQAGRIAFLPHNVYTNMPFGVEMLHLMAMEVMADWWWGGLSGQLMVALFAPAATVMIAATAERIGGRRAGWLAAIIYLSTPWIYRLAVIAYVEGPLCFYHAALIWTGIRYWRDQAIPRDRWWLLSGILAGGAMACKYPALISAVVPFGVLSLGTAIRQRSSRVVLSYVLGWSIIMLPWLAKNVIDTGNPVYPLGYKVFGARHWDEARESQWTRAHGPRAPSWGGFWSSLVDVAGRSDWQSSLYLAFAPLALLVRGSRRYAMAIMGYAAYLFLTWWFLTHRIDRFWLPLLPCLAVLAGLGADWTERLSWRMLRGFLLATSLLCNFLDCSTALTGLNEWTGNLVVLRQDLPRRLNPPLAAVDQVHLPAGAKVLMVGQAAVFHVNHEILYNTVFNPETLEVLAAGTTPQEFQRTLKDRGISHIYLDWKEIQRHRDPAGYGFTDFVTPELLASWVKAGVLAPPWSVGSEQQLFAVR